MAIIEPESITGKFEITPMSEWGITTVPKEEVKAAPPVCPKCPTCPLPPTAPIKEKELTTEDIKKLIESLTTAGKEAKEKIAGLWEKLREARARRLAREALAEAGIEQAKVIEEKEKPETEAAKKLKETGIEVF